MASSDLSIQKLPLDLYCVFHWVLFVLTRLSMSYVQADTCNVHEKVTSLTQKNLCSAGLNKCGLYS